MTDEMLNYHADNFIHLEVRSRLNITFDQFLIDPIDDEKIVICRELGISSHIDLGIHGGHYSELIKIGSHTKRVNTPIHLINKDNVNKSRFKFLKKAIKAFKRELKTTVSTK